MHLTVQIPKLIALASVALRIQWRECDEHLEQCTTDFMAVGGILHLDILSLPVPSNKANGWTLRPVTHDSLVIHRSALQQQGDGRAILYQLCGCALPVQAVLLRSNTQQIQNLLHDCTWCWGRSATVFNNSYEKACSFLFVGANHGKQQTCLEDSHDCSALPVFALPDLVSLARQCVHKKAPRSGS